jgi:hypothetical protein
MHHDRQDVRVEKIIDDLQGVPATGEPDRDLIIRTLFTLEQKLGEDNGWDAPAVFMVLVMPQPGIIAAGIIPQESWMPGEGCPPDALADLADRYPAPPLLGAAFRRPADAAGSPGALVGFALMCEAWGLPTENINPLHRAAARAGLRTFQDDPDRMEARHILAVDVDGRAYLVCRRRGEDKPALDMTDVPASRGNVTTTLDRLTRAALAGTFPYDRL